MLGVAAEQAPAATDVLTTNFPSTSEMLGWLYGNVWGWVSSHLLMTIVVIVGALVWFFGLAVHRAVASV